MKKITLTCKDSGKFFHDCVGCNHYNRCDYFGKNKRRNKDEKNKSNKQANPRI